MLPFYEAPHVPSSNGHSNYKRRPGSREHGQFEFRLGHLQGLTFLGLIFLFSSAVKGRWWGWWWGLSPAVARCPLWAGPQREVFAWVFKSKFTVLAYSASLWSLELFPERKSNFFPPFHSLITCKLTSLPASPPPPSCWIYIFLGPSDTWRRGLPSPTWFSLWRKNE